MDLMKGRSGISLLAGEPPYGPERARLFVEGNSLSVVGTVVPELGRRDLRDFVDVGVRSAVEVCKLDFVKSDTSDRLVVPDRFPGCESPIILRIYRSCDA